MSRPENAVVIGAGPNGLAAAIALAQAGVSVHVIEGHETVGGGTRTAELTAPGFLHDVCAAVHPMGILSPYLRTLPLREYGLEWIKPEASVAHPLDDEPAVMLWRSLARTSDELGVDSQAYRRLITPFLERPQTMLADLMAPLGFPRQPLKMLRFGLTAIRSADSVARGRFREERARALFAGCAAHAIMPLEHRLTAALGLIFCLSGHLEEWPVAKGGSASITGAMARYLRELGGTIETDRRVTSYKELPPAGAYLFDTSPAELSLIAGDALPERYRRRLSKYRYGPGVFKVDWALDGPIPWSDPNCLRASTVHLGGRLREVAAAEAAMWRGEHSAHPFVLLCQQSQFDDARAPTGQQTGYAYCHVPHGSEVDMTAAIEAQVERFAPGFRDRILARHTMTTSAFERYNPNYHGGAITGGVADLWQLFTRPVMRWNPYTTPNPKIFICSASTPPGGGVHGMCGYYAAKAAAQRLRVPFDSPLALD
jgi:phytoene dehydrogenase-like protein